MIPKITRLDWLIIFFLSVSFFISNLHLFFDGVHSDAPLYRNMNGDVGWWTFIVGFMVNLVWLMGFAVVLGMSKIRLNPKQASMIFVYGFSLYKDIFDWFENNNQGTVYIDWIITIALFAFVQFIFWGWNKARNST